MIHDSAHATSCATPQRIRGTGFLAKHGFSNGAVRLAGESAASATHGTEAGGEATNKATAADEAEAGAASGRC